MSKLNQGAGWKLCERVEGNLKKKKSLQKQTGPVKGKAVARRLSFAAKHPPVWRDAQSDVSSLPRTAVGWKMRQHRPDIKGLARPRGLTSTEELAKVMKTHL